MTTGSGVSLCIYRVQTDVVLHPTAAGGANEQKMAKSSSDALNIAVSSTDNFFFNLI